MKKKRNFFIIFGVILVLILFLGGYLIQKNHKTKQKEVSLEKRLSVLEEKQTKQTDLLKKIQNSWDTADSNFVSNTLTSEQLKTMTQESDKINEVILKEEKNKEQNEIKVLYHNLKTQQDTIQENLKKLQQSFAIVEKTNEQFKEKVIDGSTIKKDVMIKPEADFTNLTNLLKENNLIGEKLKAIASDLMEKGITQLEAKEELEEKVQNIADKNQLKPNVSVEQLQEFLDYTKDYPFPEFLKEYQSLINAVPDKITELQPTISKLSETELNRRIFAAYDPEGKDNQLILKGAFRDGKYLATFYDVMPALGSILTKHSFTFIVEKNGDYKGELIDKAGNIFKDVSKESIAKQRENLEKAVYPKITTQQFIEAVKATKLGQDFKDVFAGAKNDIPQESGYIYCTLQSPPNIIYRYSEKNGKVESTSEKIGPSSDPYVWEYAFEATQQVWEKNN